MSSLAQLEGDSLRRQSEASKKIAEEKGWIFYDSIEDIGVSAFRGKHKKDGVLGEFIRACDEGEVDTKNLVLIVEGFDRLSRENTTTAFSTFTRLLDTGLTIYTTINGQEYTSELINENNGLLFSVIGEMLRAHEESETKSARLKSAWNNKRNIINERKLTSRIPAWLELSKDRKEFLVKEEAANIVSKIFDLTIDDNMGAYSITKYLNENISTYPIITEPTNKNRLKDGKTRYGWQRSYVIKILKNKSVYGCFQPHEMIKGKRQPIGEEIEDYYPEIISKERFYLAQSRIHERSNKGGGRKGETFTNIFTKLTLCGICGGSVSYRGKGDGPKGGKYLGCLNHESGAGCTNKLWEYNNFEESFFKFISEVDYESVLSTYSNDIELFQLKDKLESLIGERDEYIKTKDRYVDIIGREDISENNLNIFLKKIDEADVLVKKIDKEMEGVSIDINNIEDSKSSNYFNELVGLIKDRNTNLIGEELKIFRQRLNAKIRQTVQKITVFNNSSIPEVYELFDCGDGDDQDEGMLGERFINFLNEIGYDTNEKIEKLFGQEKGKRLYRESERYFVVKFKNGSTKLVKPFYDISWYTLSNKMITAFGMHEKSKMERVIGSLK